MELSFQQEQELAFWKNLFKETGSLQKFLYLRHGDLIGRTEYFPEIFEEQGYGLDYGCGLLSMFEFSTLVERMRACDPLTAYYSDIIGVVKNSRMSYSIDASPIASESLDFVACFNVIDHTPDPQTIIDDIIRVLRPGGRLYFEVNFDPELFAPHHTLWTMETVKKYFPETGPLKIMRERTQINPKFPEQTIYEALIIKQWA